MTCLLWRWNSDCRMVRHWYFWGLRICDLVPFRWLNSIFNKFWDVSHSLTIARRFSLFYVFSYLLMESKSLLCFYGYPGLRNGNVVYIFRLSHTTKSVVTNVRLRCTNVYERGNRLHAGLQYAEWEISTTFHFKVNRKVCKLSRRKEFHGHVQGRKRVIYSWLSKRAW